MAKPRKKKKSNETRTWWTREKVAIALITAAAMVVVAIIGLIPHLAPSSPPPCSIGKSEPCKCEGDRTGVQICADDGSRWLPCQCKKILSKSADESTSQATSSVHVTAPPQDSPRAEDQKVGNVSTDGKTDSKKSVSSPTGRRPADVEAVPESPLKINTGRAVCSKTNCTLEGNVPQKTTNVCLDLRTSENGEYRRASRCVVNSRGVKVTCTRTGKDNLDRLIGDIRWRSPCP